MNVLFLFLYLGIGTVLPVALLVVIGVAAVDLASRISHEKEKKN